MRFGFKGLISFNYYRNQAIDTSHSHSCGGFNIRYTMRPRPPRNRNLRSIVYR